MNSTLHGEGVNKVYLPFNLSRLLEHMSLKQRRETVHNRIDDDKFIYGKTIDTVKNFVKLFIIDQGAIDTISKDEWSRKITAAISKQELLERQQRGEKVTAKDIEIAECLMPTDRDTAKNDGAFSLKRLDSFHLNQLTAKVFESPQKVCLSGKRSSLGVSPFGLNQNSASPSPKFAVGGFFGVQASPSKFSENSPIGKGNRGKAKLDKISEKDSFCTDASMVSFCSDDLSRSKKKRGERALEKHGLVEDILEEDSDDESLICHLQKLAGDQPEEEEVQLDG
jgi:hypothetical protein